MRQRTLAAAFAVALGTVLAIAAPAFAHPVLTITASPTTVTAGATTTITITGTSNGNYTNARIEVFSSTPSTGGTTGTLTSFTSSPVCAGTPATPTCTENPSSRYRLGGINLTNGQAFSYTLTVTVDASTTAGTFTTKAQFYKSDNTTDGPRTGPLITVTVPTADLSATAVGSPSVSFGALNLVTSVINYGPSTVPATLTYTVTQTASILTPRDVAESFPFICDASGTGFLCTVSAYDPGSDTGVYPAWTISLLAIGSFTITATVSSPKPDPNPANNSYSVTCTVLTGLIVNCP